MDDTALLYQILHKQALYRRFAILQKTLGFLA
jgi:hypothetical protein